MKTLAPQLLYYLGSLLLLMAGTTSCSKQNEVAVATFQVVLHDSFHIREIGTNPNGEEKKKEIVEEVERSIRNHPDFRESYSLKFKPSFILTVTDEKVEDELKESIAQLRGFSESVVTQFDQPPYDYGSIGLRLIGFETLKYE